MRYREWGMGACDRHPSASSISGDRPRVARNSSHVARRARLSFLCRFAEELNARESRAHGVSEDDAGPTGTWIEEPTCPRPAPEQRRAGSLASAKAPSQNLRNPP